jgi:hypothetical protein
MNYRLARPVLVESKRRANIGPSGHHMSRDFERQAEPKLRPAVPLKGSGYNPAYTSIRPRHSSAYRFIRRSGRPVAAVHLFPHRRPIALRVGYAGQWPSIRLERLEINW